MLNLSQIEIANVYIICFLMQHILEFPKNPLIDLDKILEERKSDMIQLRGGQTKEGYSKQYGHNFAT